MTKRKPPRPEPRVLTDPRAIRALAHPARLAVMEALSGGVELTATACAEIAGISPSAMSYHLRALEKWGIVERAESTGDGRERPWKSYPGGWSIQALPDAATAAATSAVTRMLLDRLAGDLKAWFDAERTESPAWQEVSGINNKRVWLTAEEAQQLSDLHADFLAERTGRTAVDRPEAARRVRVTHVIVPLQGD